MEQPGSEIVRPDFLADQVALIGRYRVRRSFAIVYSLASSELIHLVTPALQIRACG